MREDRVLHRIGNVLLPGLRRVSAALRAGPSVLPLLLLSAASLLFSLGPVGHHRGGRKAWTIEPKSCKRKVGRGRRGGRERHFVEAQAIRGGD